MTIHYHKDSTRAWKATMNSNVVPVTARGLINLYWDKGDGKKQRVTLGGGAGVAAKTYDENKDRKIYL